MAVGRWIECRVGLLEEGAKSLKLQLRERFRVAVVGYQSRRISKPIACSGCFSIARWILQFSYLRRQSLASTTAFYRKRVSNDFDEGDESPMTRILQSIAVPVLGNFCHVFMHGLNRVQIYGAEKLQDAIRNRSKTTPLITVNNHVASMDDPLIIASLLPPSMMLDANSLR
ncbi:hypothetical protein M569_09833 [Genlisea aurea]|uniref:Tafazzin family protein n=1 Tax=Genlisea aurea TaxID=192259 RepID=S8CDM7_9LAMI|nr:hypothetical protein M569_09833 [Genlisea aurea]